MSLFNRVVSVGNVSLRTMNESDFKSYFGEEVSLATVFKVGELASKKVHSLKCVASFPNSKEELELYWLCLDLVSVSEALYILHNTVMYDEVNDVYQNDLACA